jgi:hypothetical protein
MLCLVLAAGLSACASGAPRGEARPGVIRGSPDAAFVQYWFEGERGDSVVGASDGSRRWRAELLLLPGGAYVPRKNDWLRELVCGG